MRAVANVHHPKYVRLLLPYVHNVPGAVYGNIRFQHWYSWPGKSLYLMLPAKRAQRVYRHTSDLVLVLFSPHSMERTLQMAFINELVILFCSTS